LPATKFVVFVVEELRMVVWVDEDTSVVVFVVDAKILLTTVELALELVM
jgi:hypothetical protein